MLRTLDASELCWVLNCELWCGHYITIAMGEAMVLIGFGTTRKHTANHVIQLLLIVPVIKAMWQKLPSTTSAAAYG